MICYACDHHKDKHLNIGCVACGCVEYIPPKNEYKSIVRLFS